MFFSLHFFLFVFRLFFSFLSFFSPLFFCFFLFRNKEYTKYNQTKKKSYQNKLRLPPKKCSFKVESSTFTSVLAWGRKGCGLEGFLIGSPTTAEVLLSWSMKLSSYNKGATSRNQDGDPSTSLSSAKQRNSHTKQSCSGLHKTGHYQTQLLSQNHTWSISSIWGKGISTRANL